MRQYTHVSSWKSQVLLRYVENGKRRKRKLEYKPILYLPCEESQATHRTMDGSPAASVVIDDVWEARKFATAHPGRVHGFTSWPYQFLAMEYPDKIEFDPGLVRVGYIDIEVMADGVLSPPEKAEKEVTVITYKVGDNILVFGCRPFESDDSRVTYFLCENEASLLDKFLKVWSSPEFCPDIISGWNIEGYDLPYLVNRIRNVLGEDQAERLSPWGILNEKTVFSMGRDRTVYLPVGISVLDYQRLFHKLGVMTRACETPDDYKLNTVAHQELGEKKLDYSQYEGLHDLYVRAWDTYVQYNIQDVLLVEKLNDKLQLMELVMMMAYDCKCNFEDMLGSVKPWECKIHHELLSRGVVMPIREKVPDFQELVGAYVKESVPGGYDWVVSFDVDGMYPTIISMMNISPEMKFKKLDKRFSYDETFPDEIREYAEFLQDNRIVTGANSLTFKIDRKGYIPEILETVAGKRNDAKEEYKRFSRLYEETKKEEYKIEMAKWKNFDKGLKVLRNSCYGVITNQYFIFYDHDMAEAITSTGQMIIKFVSWRINQFLNKIMGSLDYDFNIAGDTDSGYFNFGPLVKKFMPGKSRDQILNFLDELCSGKIQEIIKGAFRDIQIATNAPVNYLSMKRESICERGIWTGKKHYILSVLDDEGTVYHEPKIKIKGMAAVKSSTPSACREKIKQAIKVIMSGTQDQISTFVDDFREEYDSLPFHDIAFPRGVSELGKWRSDVGLYKSGTPIQVRAALLYNLHRLQKNLTSYPEIYSGDKIKFAYLKTPNQFSENVMGTPGPLIPGTLECLDRDVMFEKGFIQPLRTILEAVGWERALDVHGATLEDFFS